MCSLVAFCHSHSHSPQRRCPHPQSSNAEILTSDNEAGPVGSPAVYLCDAHLFLMCALLLIKLLNVSLCLRATDWDDCSLLLVTACLCLCFCQVSASCAQRVGLLSREAS